MTTHASVALDYADRGWPVLPIRPRSKVPACAHGVHDASTDSERITKCWSQHPELGVGIATGRVSGLLVLDVDGDPKELLAKKHLPATLTQRTGRGWQYIYALPQGMNGSTTRANLLPGIDTRGDGGYIVAPPSVHPNGKRYRWAPGLSPDDLNPADPPEWLTQLLRARPAGTPTSPDEWHAIARDGVEIGLRNDTLARVVGHLFRKHVDPRVVQELSLAWATSRCRPPMDEQEAARTIQSIARAELQRRNNGSRSN